MQVWILFIITLFPIHPSNRTARRLADAIDSACADRLLPKRCAGTLVAIAYLESGFRLSAHNHSGATGVWQLMPPIPHTLRGQAREAIHRWESQGAEGYTGEGRACRRKLMGCPLASRRRLLGAMLETVEATP
jgi:Transglycosylase SLT domain